MEADEKPQDTDKRGASTAQRGYRLTPPVLLAGFRLFDYFDRGRPKAWVLMVRREKQPTRTQR